MILNNTIGWGDLCKVDSKHVINNNDFDTYLANKKEDKVITNTENKTNHSELYDREYESENKTLHGTELEFVNGTTIYNEYDEDQNMPTDTRQNEENILNRKNYEDEYKMKFCA